MVQQNTPKLMNLWNELIKEIKSHVNDKRQIQVENF